MTKAGFRTVLLACSFVLAGCAASHVDKVEWTTRIQQPPPGTSLVYFVRPEAGGESHNAILMDGDEYIGTLPEWAHLAYVTKPGTHLFTVATEDAADFMEADLEAGKTYYANLRRRMGSMPWRERFSFVAHVEPKSIVAAQELVNTTPQVRSNDVGQQWFEQKRGRVMMMKNQYYSVWQTNKSKQVMTSAAGR